MAMTPEEQKAFDEAQAKIAELSKAVEDAKAELAKQVEITENAEKKFNEMAEETGSSRKEIAEAAKALIADRAAERKAQEDLRKISEELVKLKKTSGPKDEGGQSDDDNKTADEIQAALNKEEQAKLEKAISVMSDEELEVLDRDPEQRKRLMLEVKKQAKSNPDPAAWRKKPTQEKSDPAANEDWIKDVFNRTKKSVGFQPDGPNGGTPNGGLKRLRGEEGRKPAAWIE